MEFVPRLVLFLSNSFLCTRREFFSRLRKHHACWHTYILWLWPLFKSWHIADMLGLPTTSYCKLQEPLSKRLVHADVVRLCYARSQAPCCLQHYISLSRIYFIHSFLWTKANYRVQSNAWPHWLIKYSGLQLSTPLVNLMSQVVNKLPVAGFSSSTRWSSIPAYLMINMTCWR